MSAVDESRVPDPSEAWSEFHDSMRLWDAERADVATASLARSSSSNQMLDAFAEYAARDFRSIGHKTIYLANAYRTLETIGWQYAEPVMRSLAYAILNHVGEPNPSDNDLEADRDGRRNHERRFTIRKDWLDGKVDTAATGELLVALRRSSSDECCELVVEQINRGTNAQSIYDAIFQFAAELTMRQPAIVPLHAMTTSNAMHYLYRMCADERIRIYLLLQNVAFLPRFRDAAKLRGDLAERSIDRFPFEVESSGVPNKVTSRSAALERLENLFEQLGREPEQAANTLGQALDEGVTIEDVIHKSRQLIFLKGNDSHDYKYSSAVLEDVYRISPAYRHRYLAASLFKMRHALEPTTPLVMRIREALS